MAKRRATKNRGSSQPGAMTPAQTPTTELTDHQHYATFTVELLMNEDNTVRRTRVKHVQTGEEQTCADWDEAQIASFIAMRSDLHHSDSQPASTLQTTINPSPELSELVQPAMPEGDNSLEPKPIIMAAVTNDRSLNTLHISEITVLHTSAVNSGWVIREGQPYRIRLGVDFTDVAEPRAHAYHYQTIVQAKRLGSGTYISISEATGTINTSDNVAIEVDGISIPMGTYRLLASARLHPSQTPQESGAASLSAWIEGGLLKVY